MTVGWWTTAVVAFSIPYTKRHVKFTAETEEALEKLRIQYTAVAQENYEQQETNLVFKVEPQNVAKAQEVVGMISKKVPVDEVVRRLS